MYVAGVQLDIAWENRSANHEKVRELIAAAKVPRGAFIALPEMFSTGFSMRVAEIAQSEKRETEVFLAALAREHSVFVCGGVVVQGANGRGLNQSVTFSPAGDLIARYSKIHPFSYGKEAAHYSGGTEVIVHTAGEVKVAPFVCYDLRFPEVFRAAVKKGAQLYTVIANWPEAREAHWLALLKARAIENQAYVIGVNRCGNDPQLTYSGRSQILDPRGNVLADGGTREGVFGADIDIASLLAYRKDFPFLQDMKDA